MDVHSLVLSPLVQIVAIYALPVLFAITLHEAAHGYVARHFGDLTAHAQGRISLNPLRHIDLVGTIIVPLVILYFSARMMGGAGILFGWAKPVPVNYSALRKPRQHMALACGEVVPVDPAGLDLLAALVHIRAVEQPAAVGVQRAAVNVVAGRWLGQRDKQARPLQINPK